jgi:hypothetical protein
MPASQTWVSPHVLRSGDRVYQRYCPWNTGTVSGVVKGHTFTVVYDYPDRRPGQPRQRFTYPASMQRNFLIGRPPVTEVPAPVNVEE